MMTKQEGILLVSRAFGFYLTIWALFELMYLPQTLLSFFHHTSNAPHDYWWTYYGVSLSFYLVRVIGLAFTARWMLKSGSSVIRFFFPELDTPANS